MDASQNAINAAVLILGGSDFSNPSPAAIRAAKLIDTAMGHVSESAALTAQANRIRDLVSTVAIVRRDLETTLAHPEYSLERVRADIRAILEERL